MGEANRNIYFQNVKLFFDMAYKAFRKLIEKIWELLKMLKQQIPQESPEKMLTMCAETSLALYNMECKKPNFPQCLREYRQYQRKYTRPHSREFVPSL